MNMFKQAWNRLTTKRNARKIADRRIQSAVDMALESLEERRLCSVSSTCTSSALTFTSNTSSDSITVTASSGVSWSGSATGHCSYTPAVIYFYGNAGNDTFVNNTSIPSSVQGGDGNDILVGGSGNDTLQGNTGNDSISGGSSNDTLYGSEGEDTLHGDSGNDVIYGGENDDDLYGDSGNDKLYGGDGNDGVYGGVGTDELTGGSDGKVDRFLFGSGTPDTLMDCDSSDAKIEFKDGAVSWSESEVEDIDAALGVLHRFTDDKTFLERKSGTNLVFKRDGYDPDSSAVNQDNGNITFYNDAFAGSTWTKQVVFHEIGHNWDSEGDIWSAFQDASGWDNIGLFESRDAGQSTSKDGKWYYDSGANFIEDYSKTNPYEDFADCFSLYFMDRSGGIYNGDTGWVSTSSLISKLGSKFDLVSGYLGTF